MHKVGVILHAGMVPPVRGDTRRIQELLPDCHVCDLEEVLTTAMK